MENLTIGAWNPRGRKERDKTLRLVFDLFPRLQERTGQMAATLSGGEQQMLAIGRALMQNPLLLMLDEPSLGLAPLLVEEMFRVVGEINRLGMTVLLVEQNTQHALSLAHRGFVMEVGRIVLAGAGDELLANPQVRKAYLGL
jgi:branched-chain amino acid transport system ATP-binding protein